MRVLWFGTYSVGPGYPRNTVLVESLRAAGAEVRECRAPLFRGPADKIAASTTRRGLAAVLPRAVLAWLRLACGFFRAGPRDLVVVGYTGHLDIFLARLLSLVWRRPIVLDAFLSPWDTIVNDRRLLAPGSLAARLLFRMERVAMRLADLVLTDTAAGAEFLARVFSLPRRRFVPVPVGTLVRSPVRARVPVLRGGPADAAPRPFTALFFGSFVPLQGVSYILDAASLAPDLRFEIVGDGPDGPRVEEEVRARGMPNVTLLRRFVPRAELDARMAEADAVLGIFGSTAKAARVIPCKVYDGLASGLPVVTADTAAARELLRDGRDALLVDRGNPASLVGALRRLRDTEGLREALSRNAERLASEVFGRRAIGLRLKGALAPLAARAGGGRP